MTHEDGFLARLASTPADDTVRLVYADWLEEQGTDEANRKAEFLRTQHALRMFQGKRKVKVWLERKLKNLTIELPAGWLGVVSYLPIENCATAKNRSRSFVTLPTVQFAYQCPKEWAALDGTDDPTVRFCQSCKQNVYFCDTVGMARSHASEGHCVAVHAGLTRYPGDLRPDMMMTMGIMLPEGDWRRPVEDDEDE
jgi:uncharacterized protein (TIGR02996 family)